MKLLICDNFFESVDELRKMALSLNYTTHEEMDRETKSIGWKGSRSKKLMSYDKVFLYMCEQKIMKAVKEYFNDKKLYMNSYFHLTFDHTKNCIPNFGFEKYHKDSVLYAGVVYLTPDAPKEAGTSILNGNENKIFNAENIYNRLICYPGNYIHAVSDTFGDTKENARLTLSFFIDKKPLLDIGNPR